MDSLGDKTLTRHIRTCNEPIMKYREEYRLSLVQYNVEPKFISLVIWHPLFAWVKGLPLPPAKSASESKEEYVQRCGPSPAGVSWVHKPLVNGEGKRLVANKT